MDRKTAKFAGTYGTSPGRECVQVIEHGLKPQDQIGIAVPDILKLLGLFLEYGKEGFGRDAAINFGGEWAVEEIFPGLLGVLSEGFAEEGFKVERRGFSSISR